jgi:hypothetical protein
MWLQMVLMRVDRHPNVPGFVFTAQITDRTSPYHGQELPLYVYDHQPERLAQLAQAVHYRPRRREEFETKGLLHTQFMGWLTAYVSDWQPDA